MKTALTFFIASLIIHCTSFSQLFWIYQEQVSGVTTNLTSASSNGSYSSTQGWVCGNGGVVLKTTNAGTNWINVSGGGLPNTVDLTTICRISTDTAITAGNTATVTYVYRTVNGGLNWVLVFSQPNGRINSIMMKDTQTGYMYGNPVGGRWSLWRTTNKGASWDSTGLYIPQAGIETGFPNALAIRHNYIMFGTNNTRIYRSTNSGVNWSFVAAPQANTTALWIYGDTSGYPPPGYAFIYAGGQKVFRSTTAGANWLQNNCPDSTFDFVGFCPGVFGVTEGTPMCAYAVRNNNKIYFSYNGNGNFTAEYTAPAGTYNYMSTDQGMYGYSPGYSFAVRTNGGITRVDYFRGGGIKQLSDRIPEAYELSQNYPNPFNPYTFIQFAVKNYGLTKLIIYDVTGREVAVPVNEMLRRGTYEASWDASAYPSGIYFYRLVTEGYSQTKKMILIK